MMGILSQDDAVRSGARGATRSVAASALAALLLAGCSIKDVAITQIGSALSDGTSSAFAAESDLEFAGQAIPFSLKLVESLLYEQPNNPELLLAAASGYTQYAKAWIEQPADFIEDENFREAQRQRMRARRFYLRAYNYGLRGLEVAHAGFTADFRASPDRAVERLEADDVPLAYWTAAALGSAISLSRTEPEMIAQIRAVEALANRAFEIEPEWNEGALHEMLMVLEFAHPAAGEDSRQRMLRHFDRAIELSRGTNPGTYVTLAESLSVQEQNRDQFVSLLHQALAINPEEHPEKRLALTVAHQRANWLLSRADDLFIE